MFDWFTKKQKSEDDTTSIRTRLEQRLVSYDEFNDNEKTTFDVREDPTLSQTEIRMINDYNNEYNKVNHEEDTISWEEPDTTNINLTLDDGQNTPETVAEYIRRRANKLDNK